MIDWGLVSQGKYDHEQCHRIGRWIIFPITGNFTIWQNLNTQCPWPGIELATLAHVKHMIHLSINFFRGQELHRTSCQTILVVAIKSNHLLRS